MQAQPSLSALVQEKLRNYTPNLTPQELEKAKSELNEHTKSYTPIYPKNTPIYFLSQKLETLFVLQQKFEITRSTA